MAKTSPIGRLDTCHEPISLWETFLSKKIDFFLIATTKNVTHREMGHVARSHLPMGDVFGTLIKKNTQL